ILLTSRENLRGSRVTGANGALDVTRPNRRCLRSCPVNASEAGTQSWAESGKDAGPHGRTIAAPAPGIGRPVLINVVNGLRAFRTKIFHDQVNRHFLSFLHRTATPVKSAAAVDKTDEESGLAFGRARLRYERAGRSICEHQSIHAVLPPKWLFICDPVLYHRAHRHLPPQ